MCVLTVVLLGLGLMGMWMHRVPASLDQRRTATSAQGALRPLVSAPTRPRGGGLNEESATEAAVAGSDAAAHVAKAAASQTGATAAGAARNVPGVDHDTTTSNLSSRSRFSGSNSSISSSSGLVSALATGNAKQPSNAASYKSLGSANHTAR